MFDKEQKNIDAGLIATPDHTYARDRHGRDANGKHVYTQKPLTHT